MEATTDDKQPASGPNKLMNIYTVSFFNRVNV